MLEINQRARLVPKGVLFDDQRIYPWDTLRRELQNLDLYGNCVCYIYRHATTEYNERNLISGQHDTSLSLQGLEQAKSLSSSIPKKFDLIFCSRLKRTWQTMQIALQESVGEPTFYVDRRIDEVSLGEFEGKKRRFVEAFAEGNIDYAPPGGESYRHAAQRVFSFLLDLIHRSSQHASEHKVYLIFTHAGIMRIISSLVLPVKSGSEMFKLDFGNTYCIKVTPSATKVPSFWFN
jgi:broad specificity phosphatase PhoE